MKKICTFLFFCLFFVSSFAQWSPAVMSGEKIRANSNAKSLYSLDINLLRVQLSGAQEAGKNAKPVVISLPTLEGKMERFSVYSFPSVVKELADQYQLGSYSGVGLDDPSKILRFSLAPNDFQSTIIKDGIFQFIDPQNKQKTVYGVHAKTHNTGDKPFICTTDEDNGMKEDISALFNRGKSFTNNPKDFSKSNDKKYRTMRLAMSVNGEYTTYFGGTVAGALVAINASVTRCNFVFEKDFGLHLILQNFPQLIYTNATTDPYTTLANWNLQLQQTLTAQIGSAAYDIGHMFGASGGGGNAGCIGCVCIAPASNTALGKGAGITSPADGIPMGDNFDIDYVAHEMGHQLGGNHTFSHNIEGSGVNMEPGSGSTIMGYAGITGTNFDVQAHSDPYFHVATIRQVQANLISKTCDIETAVTNNPPVITPLTTYNIPKGTAFVLTATVTDPENDPMTYCWEETDDATQSISKTNIGTTGSGATFRSFNPTTTTTRYFPKFSSVIAGTLNNALNTWESVSTVARTTHFTMTARDNNAVASAQQTNSADETIVVGNDGPFNVVSNTVYNNGLASLTWNVANTDIAPYNSPNVKIDYSLDNGVTWVVLAASTPNDGSENFQFTGVATNATVKIRISSIGNVFYAIGTATVKALAACSSAAPTNLTVTGITLVSALANWDAALGATYSIRYRVVGSPTWITTTVTANSYLLSGLASTTQYEVQVANICSGVTGNYTASVIFTTLGLDYCVMTSSDSSEEYISKVVVTPNGAAVMTSNSGATNYSDYTSDATRLVQLVIGNPNNTISVTKAWQGTAYDEGVVVWVDFNRNGLFEDTEKILDTPADQTTPVTATFLVPATSYSGPLNTRMRVAMRYDDTPVNCSSFDYGEVEDYAVKFVAAAACVNTPPTNVTVNTITSTSAVVTWTANAGAATYVVQYRAVGSPTWSTVNSATNTISLTPLTPSTQYEVQIAAVCSGTQGAFTASTLFTTLAVTCNLTAPTNLTVTTITSTSAVVNWGASTGVTYVLQYRPLGSTTWITVSVATNTYTITGLTANTQYEVQVANTCSGTVGAYTPIKTFTTLSACSNAPSGLTVTAITNSSALVNWDLYTGATYVLRYRKFGTITWTTVNATTNSYTLTGLLDSTKYEVQVANNCSGTVGTFTPSTIFTTLSVKTYCLVAPDSTNEFISNVNIVPFGLNITTMNNDSGAATNGYDNYTADTTKLVYLYQGFGNNKISVSKGWAATHYNEGVKAWIDFDRSGTFEDSEVILNIPANQTTPVTANFNVPPTAFLSLDDSKYLVMRVSLSRNSIPFSCNTNALGEIEDYAVKIIPLPSVVTGLPGIQIYPNPTVDVLNFIRVKEGADYKVYDSSGRMVKQGKIINKQVYVGNLVNGVYVIDVDNYGEGTQIKFVKEADKK